MSTPVLTTESLKMGAAYRSWYANALRLIVRKWRVIATVLFVFWAVGLLFAFLTPAIYESSAVLLPSEQPTPIGLANNNALLGMAMMSGAADTLGLRTPAAKFIAILQSKTVADRLIDRFGLMSVYHAKLRTLARQRLANATRIFENRRSGEISLAVRDHDKQLAKALVQGYIDELNRLNSELNTGAAHQQRVFLEQRLEEVKKQMDVTAKDLADFSSKTAVIAPEQQVKVETESAAQLQGQIVALETRLSGLQKSYTEENPRIQEIKAQILTLQRQLRKFRGSRQMNETADNNGQLFPSLTALPHLQTTYGGLVRDSKTLFTIYEVLQQQLELAKIEEVKELPTVRVLDSPELAEFRESPRRTLIMFTFTLLALSAIAVYLFLYSYCARYGYRSIMHFMQASYLEKTGFLDKVGLSLAER